MIDPGQGQKPGTTGISTDEVNTLGSGKTGKKPPISAASKSLYTADHDAANAAVAAINRRSAQVTHFEG